MKIRTDLILLVPQMEFRKVEMGRLLIVGVLRGETLWIAR